MTSVSWVIPTMDQQILEDPTMHPQPNTPSINTCRPMSYQEEGAKVRQGGQHLEQGGWVEGPPQPNTPSINTCRPMSYQEEGAKVSKGGHHLEQAGQHLEEECLVGSAEL